MVSVFNEFESDKKLNYVIMFNFFFYYQVQLMDVPCISNM